MRDFPCDATHRSVGASNTRRELGRPQQGRRFARLLRCRQVGAAGLTCERCERASHKATLVGMYVHPDFRGLGAARALVRAILEEARATPVIEVIQLTVTTTNAPAVRLYEACGFRTLGTEPFAVRLGDDFLTKTHMWCAAGDNAARAPAATNAGLDFTYRARKSGDVEVLHHGRLAATLRGPEAAEFLARIDVADEQDAQQLMARVTGNYRRGNERVAAQHARNRR